MQLFQYLCINFNHNNSRLLSQIHRISNNYVFQLVWLFSECRSVYCCLLGVCVIDYLWQYLYLIRIVRNVMRSARSWVVISHEVHRLERLWLKPVSSVQLPVTSRSFHVQFSRSVLYINTFTCIIMLIINQVNFHPLLWLVNDRHPLTCLLSQVWMSKGQYCLEGGVLDSIILRVIDRWITFLFLISLHWWVILLLLCNYIILLYRHVLRKI